MCVILPLFYRGPLVVAQYITTSIKEINIAVYHTNVLAIYFLDGGGAEGSRQSNVLLRLSGKLFKLHRYEWFKKKKKKVKNVRRFIRKEGKIERYYSLMSNKGSAKKCSRGHWCVAVDKKKIQPRSLGVKDNTVQAAKFASYFEPKWT